MQRIGIYRERPLVDGVEASWPLMHSHFATAVPHMKSQIRFGIWLFTLMPMSFLFLAVMVLSAANGECNILEHRFTSPPSWQYRAGHYFLFGGISWLLLALSTMLLWLRFARIHVRFRPGAITVSQKRVGLGREWSSPAEACRASETEINGCRAIVLRHNGPQLTLGAGLPPDAFDRLLQLFRLHLPQGIEPLEAAIPPRFTISNDADSQTLHIGRMQGFISRRASIVFISILILPIIVSVIAGILLMDWASAHDPVVIEHNRRVAIVNPHPPRTENPGEMILIIILVLSLSGMSLSSSAKLFSTATLRINPVEMSLTKGWLRKHTISMERVGVSRFVARKGENALHPIAIDVVHGVKQVCIHAALTAEESTWLVNWVRQTWSEIEPLTLPESRSNWLGRAKVAT